MHTSFWLAIGGGVAVLGSYVAAVARADHTEVWWGPFNDKRKRFGALTFVTVAAYAVVFSWMVEANITEMWWALAGFNWSAALWVPATAFDVTFGTSLATLSVGATALFNIGLACFAAKHDPPSWVWCALVLLLFHHIAIDGIWWGGVHLYRNIPKADYHHKDNRIIKAQHVLCGVLHLGSAIYLAASAGADNFDRPIKDTRAQNAWRYSCGLDVDCEECTVDERRYYVPDVGTAYTLPVMRFAVLFAAWSGLWHVVSFALTFSQVRQTNVLAGPVAVRTIDYAVSASLMIVVVNTLFGAATPFGAVVAPVLQAIIVIIGGGLEQVGLVGPFHYGVLIVLIGLYGLVWTPAFLAMRDATVQSDVPCTAAAPGFVVIFLVVVFLVFSVFPMIWIYYGIKSELNVDNREFTYNIVSCIAKLTLHAFLAISLFGMNSRLGNSEDSLPEEPASENEQEVKAYIAATVVIVVVVVLNLALKWALKPPTSPTSAVSKSMFERLLF
jgi:hypothetical protein